jgi:hypothetical protein
MIRILFLSLETQHDKLFQRIGRSLSAITSEGISYKIVDTSRLTAIPSFYKLDRDKVAFSNNLLNEYRPDIVVVANDHGINATFLAFCKLKGIATLAVQDGILSNLNTVKSLDKALMKNQAFLWKIISLLIYNKLFLEITLKIGWPARRVCWGTTPIDRIAVMGKQYKKVFVDRGVKASRVTITGYPLLDGAVRSGGNCQKESLVKKIGFDANKPLVLLITQPFVEDGLWAQNLRDFFLKSVTESLVTKGFQLVIKLHPREEEDLCRTIGHSQGVFVTRDMSLEELMLSSDVVATVSSTAGLWALAYGKPLVVLNCFPSGVGRNLLEDLGICVNTLAELPNIMMNAQDKESKVNRLRYIDVLSDHVYKLDGKSSERIARLILALLKKKPLTAV